MSGRTEMVYETSKLTGLRGPYFYFLFFSLLLFRSSTLTVKAVRLPSYQHYKNFLG